MMVEGPKFRLWFDPGIDDEESGEAAHAICKIILLGRPQSPKRRREIAIRQALALFDGPLSRRAKELERRYRSYLAAGWRSERDLETLPEPRLTERVLLHRLARLNEGAWLCWRRIFDIASSPQDFVTLAGFTCFYCLPGESPATRFQCLSLASPLSKTASTCSM
jgi:hypothetical protein